MGKEGDARRPAHAPDLTKEGKRQLIDIHFANGLTRPGEIHETRDQFIQALMRDGRITKVDLARFLGDRLMEQVRHDSESRNSDWIDAHEEL
jgi:hypothetical protein